ncbi:MAG: hypothetical protein KDB03_02415 [Planctomycetales bacterium]|nr:hypothetical protein [Planctomycetales bacterium]
MDRASGVELSSGPRVAVAPGGARLHPVGRSVENLTVTGSNPVDATKLVENQPDPGRNCVHLEAGGQRLFGSIGGCRMNKRIGAYMSLRKQLVFVT